MSYYPNFSTFIQGKDPERLMVVRRSLRSVLSSFALLFLTTLVVVLINLAFEDPRPFRGIPVLEYFSLRYLGILPLGVLIEIIRKYNDALYTFGTENFSSFQGRLSLHSNRPVVDYKDIRCLMARQDIVGRIFDYGDLLIGTSAQQGFEMKIIGVRDPCGLQRLLEEMRAHAIKIDLNRPASTPNGPAAVEKNGGISNN